MSNVHDDAPDAVPCGRIEVELAVMARNTELLRRRSMSPGELGGAAYLILRALATSGPTDINTLATTLGLDASTVGRQLTALADEQLVTRAPDRTDHRRASVDVSSEGRRRLAITAELRRRRTTDLLSEWHPDDLSHLADLLARYNATVAKRYMTGIATVQS